MCTLFKSSESFLPMLISDIRFYTVYTWTPPGIDLYVSTVRVDVHCPSYF